MKLTVAAFVLSVAASGGGAAGQECPEGFVTCCKGFEGACDASGDPTSDVTCRSACDGGSLCCAQPSDCDGFTGKVCKDGSCSKTNTDAEDGVTFYGACYDATIDEVIRGCTGGSRICKDATIGKVVDGCIGYGACAAAGKNGGTVNLIQNSCITDDSLLVESGNACDSLAKDGGTVDKVINSCKGKESCLAVGIDRLGSGGGSVDEIINSCHGPDSCEGMASGGGNVTLVQNSCISTGTEKERACSLLPLMVAQSKGLLAVARAIEAAPAWAAKVEMLVWFKIVASATAPENSKPAFGLPTKVAQSVRLSTAVKEKAPATQLPQTVARSTRLSTVVKTDLAAWLWDLILAISAQSSAAA